MNWNRVLRDLTVVLLLGATFYISAIVVGQIDEILPPADKSFSRERLAAENSHTRGDWLKSAEHFQAIIDQDPYNGYASFQLVTCYLWLRFNTQEEIDKLTESDADPAKLESLRQRFIEFEDLALSALEKSREFLRHRRSSLYHLSAIHSDREEFDVALKYLEQFVDGGFWLNFGLENAERFGSGGRDAITGNTIDSSQRRLHQFEKFWELVDRESQTRSQNFTVQQLHYPTRASN